MDSKFSPGDKVRVMERSQPGHVRTPMYVRGKSGVIERIVAVSYTHLTLPTKA